MWSKSKSCQLTQRLRYVRVACLSQCAMSNGIAKQIRFVLAVDISVCPFQALFIRFISRRKYWVVVCIDSCLVLLLLCLLFLPCRESFHGRKSYVLAGETRRAHSYLYELCLFSSASRETALAKILSNFKMIFYEAFWIKNPVSTCDRLWTVTTLGEPQCTYMIVTENVTMKLVYHTVQEKGKSC